jgi:hypothetical protein
MGFEGKKLTPAEWHAVCDVARVALALQSADVLDEQLAGFGEILKELVEAVQGLQLRVTTTIDDLANRDQALRLCERDWASPCAGAGPRTLFAMTADVNH